MDELDRRLIIELQTAPRKSSARIAKSIGITEAKARRRIERLVSSSEIAFTALPDLQRFGYTTNAYIGLKIERPAKLSAIAEQLCRYPYLRFVSSCEGFADLILSGDFISTTSLSDFIINDLGKIDDISRINTMVELQQVKTRTFGRLVDRDMPQQVPAQTGNSIIDEVDRHLIFELQKDGRAPLTKLASLLGVNESTVYRRINKLVASRVIELTAIPRSGQIGYSTHGLVFIEAKLANLTNVADAVAHHPKVSFVGIYSGPTQILAGIRASSHEELLNLATQELINIENIIRVDLLILLKVFKRSFSWLQQ
jgi:Lrp/AsnC family transcriptional regulator for asnA, asnC and gidA